MLIEATTGKAQEECRDGDQGDDAKPLPVHPLLLGLSNSDRMLTQRGNAVNLLKNLSKSNQ
jgi:hypothetical protein